MTQIDASSKEQENKAEHLPNLPNSVINVKEILHLQVVALEIRAQNIQSTRLVQRGQGMISYCLRNVASRSSSPEPCLMAWVTR